MCDPGDLGLHSDAVSSLTEGQPTVVIYEMVPAGIGFSERLFECHDVLIHQAHSLVTGCACADGCPSCVGPGGERGNGGKRETLAILNELI
jgi:DEAD/DEAH box helicase domain-containing protein